MEGGLRKPAQYHSFEGGCGWGCPVWAANVRSTLWGASVLLLLLPVYVAPAKPAREP